VLVVSNDDVVEALHREENAAGSAAGPQLGAAAGEARHVHFVQMWVLPDRSGVEPGYERLDATGELDRGGPVVAAPRGWGSTRATAPSPSARSTRRCTRHGCGRPPRPPCRPPRWRTCFVARDSVDLEGTGPLGSGDTACATVADGQRVTAGPGGAEVLVREMHATPG